MDKEKSNQEIIDLSKEANVTTMSSSDASVAAVHANSVHPEQQILENLLLLWLDPNFDISNDIYSNTLKQLQNIVEYVHPFKDTEECVNFFTDLKDVKTFLVISEVLVKHTVPRIHDIPCLHSIYVLCDNKSQHEQWNKDWFKIKDVYTQITPICEALKQAVKQWIQDYIPISFISTDDSTSNQNLEELEPSFMYTQLLKEILFDIDYDQQAVEKFADFWRRQSGDNDITLKTITKFEYEYRWQSAIEWYTRELFLYSMVNRALRLLQTDIIVKMAFFVCDLHRQIQDLHKQKPVNCPEKTFILYRGQGLSKRDFQKLMKTKGGLMSFNSFLSTSTDRAMPYALAESNQDRLNTIGILFKITVDPSISSIPFADITAHSKFPSEGEILFSMHTVFRIGKIDKIGSNDRLYQVELKLTSDDDQELRNLTDRLRKETPGPTPWDRLGRLLYKLGQFSKAEELYTTLLEKTQDDIKKALYYNQLGLVEYKQGNWKDSICFFEQFREILQKLPILDNLLLATYYNNIGMTYDAMGEHSKALSLHQNSLEIRETNLSADHPDLATSYNNIGLQYDKLRQYLDALLSFKKSLEIKQRTLPHNHPHFAQTYNNMGMVYLNMKDYPNALSHYKKALEIKQKSLPENHPSLAIAYNNIGLIYYQMEDYQQALVFHEKDLEISQKTLRTDHPDLGTSYNNIAGIYYETGELTKALSYFERAYTIFNSSLPPNHPDLEVVRKSIELVKTNLKVTFDK